MSEFTIVLSSDVDGEDMVAMNRRYASMAINRTARKARTLATAEIKDQLNLPSRYVGGNLYLGAPSTPENLATEIRGRVRPTSLARYAKGTPESTRKSGFVRVEVARGRVEKLPRAFLLRLRGRHGLTDEANANIGLAIRLRQGEHIHNKRVSIMQTMNGLTMLYGPSVDQAFKSVRGDIAPDVGDFLANEYMRLGGVFS